MRQISRGQPTNATKQADILATKIGRVYPSRHPNVATMMPSLLPAAGGNGLVLPHRRLCSSRHCVESAAAAILAVATVLMSIAAMAMAGSAETATATVPSATIAATAKVTVAGIDNK